MRATLQDRGVFGSVAFGSDHHDSDVDLLVDLDPAADPLDVANFVGEAIELLGFEVDLVIDVPDVDLHLRAPAVQL